MPTATLTLTALITTAIALGGTCMTANALEPWLPPGMWTNDNWFARDGETYHAFYLMVPRCMGDANDWSLRGKLTSIGHATSTDLVNWQDQGPVVVPIPGSWHSRLATGSVARFEGRWWMVFTTGGVNAEGSPVGGVGLAVSDDLMAWKPVGDGPVALNQPYETTWQGAPIKWTPYADPYLYPEPIDGWMVMVLNAGVIGAPTESAGCLPTLRSQDMLHWEPGPMLDYPQWVERPETPQLWERNGRWYLYYGAAHDQPQIAQRWLREVPAEIRERRRVNCLMVADRFEGPYRPAPGTWWLDALPDGRGGYIHKVLPGPGGSDVLVTTTGQGLSVPYRVQYGEDGSLTLLLP